MVWLFAAPAPLRVAGGGIHPRGHHRRRHPPGVLFLPREYAALRAKYSALDVDAARALARNPEGRALIAASKLAARKELDRATRDDASKGWKTRFVKEQVGFGNTWRQQ